MQATKRYLLLAVTFVTLTLVYLVIVSLKRRGFFYINVTSDGILRNGPAQDDRVYVLSVRSEMHDMHISPHKRRQNVPTNATISPKSSTDFEEDMYTQKSKERHYAGVESSRKCSFESCFDFNLCAKGYKVYVYPEMGSPISRSYRAVLSSLLESRFYTMEPSEACIFVLAIDTLDRDTLSVDYVHNIPELLRNLEPWNKMGGKNHIIFNMYSGTWPTYTEDLGFDYGHAILAKASIPNIFFRHGFDISLPLFGKEHPHKGGEHGQVVNSPLSSPKYLLTFKGKRYLKGIGSHTRNSLYHIHNDKDIVLVATCRHGKNWKSMADERCEEDNRLYDMYDFKKLLMNSTFCLVPRGRRLGSYRFLEALQMGCIPVLLSNDWHLPFSDRIDWSEAAVWGDERLLLQLPSIVRSLKKSQIVAMRQQTQFLWETYFSSIDKIIDSTLIILHDRIFRHLTHSRLIWNIPPGALAVHPDFSDTPSKFPFFYHRLNVSPGKRFTAVIYATTPVLLASSPLFRLIRTVLKSAHIHRVVVVWHCDVVPPVKQKWPSLAGVPVIVITRHSQTISARFYPYKVIETDAVLSLDEDALLTVDEINFAFSVWREFPDRIVGYPCRNHFWNEARARWGYTSKWTNDYSIVLTGAAFYHRYYNHIYTYHLSPLLTQTVDQTRNCEDILMNFVVGHVTKLPPIKLTQRRQYKETLQSAAAKSVWREPEHLAQRGGCLNSFVATFGYMPLVRSSVRLDTMLYKDPVSNLRKKYRQIEVVV